MKCAYPHKQDIDNMTRTAIARVCNILYILATHYMPITDAVLANAYEWVIEQEPECEVKELLRGDNAEALILDITARVA